MKHSNIKKDSKSADNSDKSKTRFYDKKKLLLESIPFALVIISFIIALVVYPQLPSKIPVHWDANGVANGYSGSSGIFMIPVISLIVMIVLFFLPLMEVYRENMIKIYNYYYAFKVFFAAFFTILFISTILPNFGYNINVATVVIALIGIMFIWLGFTLPKLKRNFMFGIRNGWTLSSDDIWEKTHKLGGRIFLAIGALTLIFMMLIPMEILFFTFIAIVILTSIFLVLYSYKLYRNRKKNL
jgi:uncharacterized membrane protein